MSTEYSLILQTIRDRWQSTGIETRSGLSSTVIESFERSNNVILPDAMRQFHEFMDGMVNWQMDDALMNLWPLSRVNRVTTVLSYCRGIPDYGGIETNLPDASSYFAIADHSISICVFAVRLTPDPANEGPVVQIWNGNSWFHKWSSYAEFMRSYADDPWQLL